MRYIVTRELAGRDLVCALAPGEALVEQGLLGRVGGQLEGALVGGAGLAGLAQLAEQLGAAGVVEVVLVKLACQVINFGHRGP
jgi:hypothetical protein